MRKIIALVVVLFIIFWGCKKQDTSPSSTVQNEPNLIKVAREYFEKTIPPRDPLHSQTGLNSIDSFNIGKLDKTVIWDKAITFHRDNRVMVVVPIKFNTGILQRASFNNRLFKQRSDDMTRLVIYQDSTSKYRIVLVNYLPNVNFLNNPTGSFAGLAVVRDWDGNMLAGFRYSNDSTYQLKLDKTTNTRDSVSTNIAQPPPGEVTVETCDYVDYYTQVTAPDGSTDTHFTSSALIGCTYSYAPNGSATYVYQLSQIGIDSKAIGGSTNVYTPPFDSINIDPSVRGNELCVIKELSSAGLNSCVSAIFCAFDNLTQAADLNISVGRSLPNNETATTTPSTAYVDGKPFYRYATVLSDAKLHYASQEYVAETILHEVLHTWIDYQTGVVNNLNGHYTMLSSFVDDEVDALKEMFPYLNNASYGNDPLCLVLAGLISDTDLNQSFVNQILTDRGLTAAQVNSVNAQYQAGTKGIPCSSTPVQ